jgi:hypothetical protein
MILTEPRLNASYPLLNSKIGDELYNKATGGTYGVIVNIIEDSCYYVQTPYQCYVVRDYYYNLGFAYLLDGGNPLQTIEVFECFLKEKNSLNGFIVNKILVVKP